MHDRSLLPISNWLQLFRNALSVMLHGAHNSDVFAHFDKETIHGSMDPCEAAIHGYIDPLKVALYRQLDDEIFGILVDSGDVILYNWTFNFLCLTSIRY